jgi:diguanylate cyclase (GGDEF)-like protein
MAGKSQPLPRALGANLKRFLRAVVDAWDRVPPALVVAISLFIVGLNFWASYSSRDDVRFSFFYLVPVALTSWFVGRRTGFLFAFLGAAAWFLEAILERHFPSQQTPVVYWNAALLFGFFLLLSAVMSALRGALQREKAAARLDPLTRLPNRRSFFELAEAEIERMARYGGRFSVAYMDLDNFKAVNDRDGHATGDRVLVLTAETLRKSLRANDVVARIGGDEFLLLLPETGAREAEAVFRKLREKLTAVMREGDWPVTFSVGAATFEKVPESADQMVHLVDELMYSAKAGGKDRLEKVVVGG